MKTMVALMAMALVAGGFGLGARAVPGVGFEDDDELG